MGYYRWRPYVTVERRKANALKKIEKLKKKNKKIQPIKITTRKIATTFWGKSWCDHIESFSDYDNRLPRGRSYVRNGSVCHLEIKEKEIKAMVAGSELYNIKIKIDPLSKAKWEAIKKMCLGKIGSILDLLQGKLSDGVMDIVCDRETGLFPLSHEIKLSCSCPDWADMCKHIAAVLYGVGSRLDQDPAQLFLLRQVNYEELIDISSAVIDATKKSKKKTIHLEDSALSNIFNIQIESNKQKTTKKISFPKILNGLHIRKKRKSLGLTQINFAKKIGVSQSTVSYWEAKKRKKIATHTNILKKLKKIWL